MTYRFYLFDANILDLTEKKRNKALNGKLKYNKEDVISLSLLAFPQYSEFHLLSSIGTKLTTSKQVQKSD